jgi:GT2 family glycosyltransferase
MPTSVSVTIVAYNSSQYLEACLRSVFQQTHRPLEVVVVDNASTDATWEILKKFAGRIRVILNGRNLGFAAAQNQAIRASQSDWVLALNPDTALEPGFIQQLVEGGQLDSRVGTVCGLLLACGPDLRPLDNPAIDSAGIYFTPSMRHFDRGWREPDDGRFREMEYVFGASGAAALYRREMIADVSDRGNFFDPDFFTYREDADVAWRAQLLGWRCLYVPEAVGYHVRSVGPRHRRSVPAVLNMHSVKNRFLMRIKNATSGLYREFWLPATARDLLVLGGCLLWEQRSLPAFWRILMCLPRAIGKRRRIMQRRRVSDESLAQWFSAKAVAPYAPVPNLGSSLRKKAVTS